MRERAARLAALNVEVVGCTRCARLVQWCRDVSRAKRAAYSDDAYWGRPVPSFGDPGARVLVVGLAPAAHGANRTGRMFTGDRSGDWLFRALHRAGFASRPDGRTADDGLTLSGAYITAAVRCAPPDNRPTPDERDSCRPFLERELDALADLTVIVTLGGFAFAQVLRILRSRGLPVPRPRPKFSHQRRGRRRGGHRARVVPSEPAEYLYGQAYRVDVRLGLGAGAQSRQDRRVIRRGAHRFLLDTTEG